MYNFVESIDLDTYQRVDEYPPQRYKFSLIQLPEKYTKNDNPFFEFKEVTVCPYIHYGEYVAYRLAQKAGIDCCKVSLFKRKIDKGYREYQDAAISFYDLNSDEEIVNPYSIISKYAERNNYVHFPLNIEMLFNAVYARFNEENRPQEEFDTFRRDFIRMITFDVRFGNFDRGIENWLFKRNKKTGAYSLYPMFDNEAILGFSAYNVDAQKSNEFIQSYNERLPFRVVPPHTDYGEINIVNGYSVYKYLLNTYPEETKEATEMVNRVSYEDFEAILEELPPMEDNFSVFTRKNFLYREKRMEKIYEEYIKQEEQKKLTKTIEAVEDEER